MTYLDKIKEAMNLLANEGYIFLGQSVRYSGTGMYHSIKHLPMEQRIELPVFEDVQAGMSIGMALEGMKLCSIYPRWDFVLLATNQIVNHLDKIKEMSDGQFDPFVIIRTSVGSVKPLFPGPQHTGNYTEAFRKMLKYVKVYELRSKEVILDVYKKAMEERIPCIIVEYPDLYAT